MDVRVLHNSWWVCFQPQGFFFFFFSWWFLYSGNSESTDPWFRDSPPAGRLIFVSLVGEFTARRGGDLDHRVENVRGSGWLWLLLAFSIIGKDAVTLSVPSAAAPLAGGTHPGLRITLPPVAVFLTASGRQWSDAAVWLLSAFPWVPSSLCFSKLWNISSIFCSFYCCWFWMLLVSSSWSLQSTFKFTKWWFRRKQTSRSFMFSCLKMSTFFFLL